MREVLAKPGLTATYRRAKEDHIPSSAVRVFELAFGPLERRARHQLQWVSLHGIKANGEEYRVWLLTRLYPPQSLAKARQATARYVFQGGDAEALELKFRGRTDVAPEEYLRMVRKKAADVEAYMKVGAMLGGGRVREIQALGKYGRILGMLVILRDDVEDLLDFEVELPSRIKNESLPTPILYALENEEVKAGVTAVLRKGQINEGDAEALISLISKAKGFERLWKFFDRLETQAAHEVENFDEKWKMAFKLILKVAVPPIPKDLMARRCD